VFGDPVGILDSGGIGSSLQANHREVRHEWGSVFPDKAMTLAAVDRLVHHATIFEMNVDSYRRKAAEKAKGRGRPPIKASPADTKVTVRCDRPAGILKSGIVSA